MPYATYSKLQSRSHLDQGFPQELNLGGVSTFLGKEAGRGREGRRSLRIDESFRFKGVPSENNEGVQPPRGCVGKSLVWTRRAVTMNGNHLTNALCTGLLVKRKHSSARPIKTGLHGANILRRRTSPGSTFASHLVALVASP